MAIISVRSPRFGFRGGKGSTTPQPSPSDDGPNPGAFGQLGGNCAQKPGGCSQQPGGAVDNIAGGAGGVGNILGGSGGTAPTQSPSPTPTPSPSNRPSTGSQKSGGTGASGSGGGAATKGGGDGFQKLPVVAQVSIIIGAIAIFFLALVLFRYFRSKRKDRPSTAFVRARDESDVDAQGYLVPPWEQSGGKAGPGTSVLYTKMERNSINTRSSQGSYAYLGVSGDAEQQRLNPEAPPISPVTPIYVRSPTPPRYVG